MRLNSFEATYAASGEASNYVSNVTVLDHGRTVQTKNILVNDFLSVDGVNVYQQDYGWAPTIVVKNPAGQTVYDGAIQFFDDPSNLGDKALADGVLKVPTSTTRSRAPRRRCRSAPRCPSSPTPSVIPSVGSNGSINPSAIAYGPGGVAPRNPVIEMQLYVGNLGLNSGAPQNVNQLNTACDDAVLHQRAGDSDHARSDDARCRSTPRTARAVDFTISFPSVTQYSLFQVNDDQGVLLVYTSFILIMTGLLTKLYLRPFLERRRRMRRQPITLDRRWSSDASGEPQAPEREPASV